jgi:hypothetical protein
MINFYLCINNTYVVKKCLSLSQSGEMCAMKEVTLFSDDAKSLESAKQLMQVYFSLLNLAKFHTGKQFIFVGAMLYFLVLNLTQLSKSNYKISDRKFIY